LLDAPHIVGCTFKQVFFTFRTTQAVSHSHNMWMKVGGSFPSGWGGLWWEGWLWWQIGDPCPQEGGQFLAHLGAILYVVMCILQSYKYSCIWGGMAWHGEWSIKSVGGLWHAVICGALLSVCLVCLFLCWWRSHFCRVRDVDMKHDFAFVVSTLPPCTFHVSLLYTMPWARKRVYYLFYSCSWSRYLCV
jgi:hypothetical protein